MHLRKGLVGYFQLLRIQTAAATALTPVIGALVMGQFNLSILFILFIIGFFYHVFGFVFNEYIDIKVDKKSVDLEKKPLISGAISRQRALFIAAVSGFFTCFLTIYFFFSLLPILFLIISLSFGGIYDFFGKKIPGLDFALGLGFFFLCLMGASTFSSNFTSLTYLVCLIYFIHISFNNSVEGGLKDVDHDYLAGAKTLATIMGVSVQNMRLKVTKKFLAFSYILKFIFVLLIILLFLEPQINLLNFEKNTVQLILVVFFVIVVFFTMYNFLNISVFDRSKLKKLFSLHEMSSFFLLVICLSPLIDLWSTLTLIFLPFIWYILTNFILYGKFLQPQV